MDLMIDYSASDFAQAIRQLLPKGEYWQEAENEELKKLINGIAQEFKHVHDDIQFSLVPSEQKKLFGWKISDYQALLYEYVDKGRVYDDPQTPCLIYVELEHRAGTAEAWQAFEDKRLPHTAICWAFKNQATLVLNCIAYRKITNHRVYKL